MTELRCGILCGKCEFYTIKACQDCLAITKPFWADIFWNSADNMPKGLRLKQCQAWCKV